MTMAVEVLTERPKGPDEQNNEQLVIELRNELLAAEEWAGEILPQLDQLRSENTQNGKELTTLRRELSMWKDIATMLETEQAKPNPSKEQEADQRPDPVGTLDALKKELGDTQSELEEIRKKLATTCADLTAAQDRERDVAKELGSAKEREGVAQKENEAATQRERKVQKELDVAQQRVRNANGERDAAKLRERNAQKELDAAKQREKSLQKELDAVKKREETSQKELDAVKQREQGKRTREDENDVKEKLALLQKEIAMGRKEIAAVQNELVATQKELEVAREHEKRAQEEVASLARDGSQLEEACKQKVASFEQSAAKEQEAAAQLRAEKKTMKEENDKLRKTVVESEKVHATLKSKIAMLDEEAWQHSRKQTAFRESVERGVMERVRADLNAKALVMERTLKEYETLNNQMRNRLVNAEKELKMERKKRKSIPKQSETKGDDFELLSELDDGWLHTFKKVRKSIRLGDAFGMLVALVLIHVFIFPQAWRLK